MEGKHSNISFRAVIAAAICLFFSFILLSFIKPLDSELIDLSISVEDGAEWDGNTEGWSFYKEDGSGERTELHIDSSGSCVLPEQGITFAYSRVMTESLQIPQLTVHVRNCNIAVLLDDDVLYNDCPDTDVTLPGAQLESVDYDRFDIVSVLLPDNYEGKTLTILQSTPSFSEIPGRSKAYLCSITLANDKAEESTLISSGYKLALCALMLFLAGVITLCSALLRCNTVNYSYAVLSSAAFFQMIRLLSFSGFWRYYIPVIKLDISSLANALSVMALLIFLTLRLNRRSRLLWGICAAELVVLTVQHLSLSGVIGYHYSLAYVLPSFFSCCTIIFMLAAAILASRRKDPFFCIFVPTVCAVASIWIVSLLIALPFGFAWGKNAILQFRIIWKEYNLSYWMYRLHILGLIASVISTCICVWRQAAQRHLETQLLKDRSEMALASYDQLCQSDRQIMMLQHDMRHHFAVLSEMDNIADIRSYVSQLVAQEQSTHSFLRTGNSFLDTIINGKLGGIDRDNIELEVVRCYAPAKLKITDSELCSVMMNVIENAVNGARNSGAERPFIRLDLHIKGNVLVCTVENSAKAAEEIMPSDESSDNIQYHGFGLHIIRKIMDRYGYPMYAGQNDGIYKVVLTILSDS